MKIPDNPYLDDFQRTQVDRMKENFRDMLKKKAIGGGIRFTPEKILLGGDSKHPEVLCVLFGAAAIYMQNKALEKFEGKGCNPIAQEALETVINTFITEMTAEKYDDLGSGEF